MSEITKLYENAGIKPNCIDACTVKDKYWQNEELANEYGTFDMYMNAKCGHQEDCTTLCSCAYTKEEYPSFTAEKQIELIKWLCKETYRNYLLFRYNSTNYYWQIECNMTDSDKLDNFTDTIASIINNLWQDLSEEERKQIKEILE